MAETGKERLHHARCGDEVVLTLKEIHQEHMTVADLGPHDLDVVVADDSFRIAFRHGVHTALAAFVTFVACPCDWEGKVTPGRYVGLLAKRIKQRQQERGDVEFLERRRDPENEGERHYCYYLLHLRSFTLAGAYEEVRELEQELYAELGDT